MQIAEKIKLLDHANIECNWGHPNSKMIDLPTWAQVITPGATHSSANCVYRSILAPDEVSAKVNRTIELYESMKVPYRWLVTPLTRPTNLAEILAAKDMKLHYEASGMMSGIDEQIRPIASEISIVPVTLENANVYVDTFVRCWQLPVHQVPDLRKDIQWGLQYAPNRFFPVIAYWNGAPVGTSSLLNIPSGGYLAAGTVDPNYRGRGIYRAMISYRAQVAKQLGHKVLLIHAKKLTSAPIAQKAGFESVYDYQVFSKELNS